MNSSSCQPTRLGEATTSFSLVISLSAILFSSSITLYVHKPLFWSWHFCNCCRWHISISHWAELTLVTHAYNNADKSHCPWLKKRPQRRNFNSKPCSQCYEGNSLTSLKKLVIPWYHLILSPRLVFPVFQDIFLQLVCSNQAPNKILILQVILLGRTLDSVDQACQTCGQIHYLNATCTMSLTCLQ